MDITSTPFIRNDYWPDYNDINQLNQRIDEVEGEISVVNARLTTDIENVSNNLNTYINAQANTTIANNIIVNDLRSNYASGGYANYDNTFTNNAYIENLTVNKPIFDVTLNTAHMENTTSLGGNFYNANLIDAKFAGDVSGSLNDISINNLLANTATIPNLFVNTSPEPVQSSAVLGYDSQGRVIPIHATFDPSFPDDADYLWTDSHGTAFKGTKATDVDTSDNLITSHGVLNVINSLNAEITDNFNLYNNVLNDIDQWQNTFENSVANSFNDVNNTFNTVNIGVNDLYNFVNNSFNDVNNSFNDVNNSFNDVNDIFNDVNNTINDVNNFVNNGFNNTNNSMTFMNFEQKWNAQYEYCNLDSLNLRTYLTGSNACNDVRLSIHVNTSAQTWPSSTSNNYTVTRGSADQMGVVNLNIYLSKMDVYKENCSNMFNVRFLPGYIQGSSLPWDFIPIGAVNCSHMFNCPVGAGTRATISEFRLPITVVNASHMYGISAEIYNNVYLPPRLKDASYMNLACTGGTSQHIYIYSDELTNMQNMFSKSTNSGHVHIRDTIPLATSNYIYNCLNNGFAANSTSFAGKITNDLHI